MDATTAVMLAAKSGSLDVVRSLVAEGGANVEAEAMNGRTALSEAAEQGHEDVVRFLVAEGGAEVETKDSADRRLRVRVLDYESGQRLVSLSVNAPASVLAVKRLIKSILAIPKKEQWLYRDGTSLKPRGHLATQQRLTLHLRRVPPACHGCGATQALRYCSRCLDAHYCGEDCQLADWSEHRRICSAGE